MATFLLKSEPGEYSYSDLERDKRTAWTGITNPAALKALRSARAGDEAFFYHTGDEKAIVGLARIVKGAYPDPKKPGNTAAGETKFPIVDLAPLRPAKVHLPLATIREDKRLSELGLVKQTRLSAMIVPPNLDSLLRKLCGL
ncbi:MAG: EVE domain-containing protein [Phycisphaeraceae bacterium]|nr:EVE domain-containing protein [Phycisphaeraceae bacterium]